MTELLALKSAIGFWLVNGWVYVLAAFLIGSIPFGLVVSRVFFKTDIRTSGSGNIGAANALRTMGYKAGAAVLVLDALKGVAATLLPYVAIVRAGAPLPQQSGFGQISDIYHSYNVGILCAICAVAAILGHCYSPWLRFRGGKGVATLLGVLLAVSWPSALIFIAVWLSIVLPTGFASLGSILGTLAAIAFVACAKGYPTLYFSLPAAAIIIWQHRENISRLLAGRENRLNLLKK